MRQAYRLMAILAGVMAAHSAHAEVPVGQAFPPPSPELLVAPTRAEHPKGMHPAVILRDQAGQPVATSGGLVSFLRSCGGCHDAAWIGQHGYHFRVGFEEQTELGKAASGRAWDFGPGLFGRWDPLAGYDSLIVGDPRNAASIDRWIKENRARLVGGGPANMASAARDYAPNCALCHVRGATLPRDLQLPFAAYQTAALQPLGLVEVTVDAAGTALGNWKKGEFLPDGAIDAARLTIQAPKSEACAQCHGIAAQKDPQLSDWGAFSRQTETTGQLFVASQISDSTLNVAGRATLGRPWDVHAERLLECADCHFSPNDPSSAFRARGAQPAHLKHEARNLPLGEYLRRPSHEFAKGYSTQGNVANALDGTMRRCEDCHDALRAHRWLPRTERHLAQVGCETCHVETVHAPARRVTDYSVIDAEGQPRVEYRGIGGSMTDPAAYLPGYHPVWLRRKDATGNRRLLPYNIVTSFYWVVDDPTGRRPASLSLLKRAFYDIPGAETRLKELLDRNRDGRIEDEERSLSTQAQLESAKSMLVAAGAQNPRIVGEMQPYGIHHGIAPARFALRRCVACHNGDSLVVAAFGLAERGPFGVVPALVGDSNIIPAYSISNDANGRLSLLPDVSATGLHVFGLSRTRWLDTFGLLAVGIVLAGALGHGGLRVWSSRNRQRRS